MVTEELLGKINEGLDKVEELNAELATSLYGSDTGYRGFYDEFWDTYQDYGNRTYYRSAFAFVEWDETNYKPKYDIVPTNALDMYCGANLTKVSYKNIKIDFSKCTGSSALNQVFQGNGERGVVNVDIDVDCSGMSSISQTFGYNPRLVSIKKLIVHENLTYTNVFINSKNIVEITIEGVIGQNGFNIRWSTKLNRPSIESIINALSTTTSGLIITLSKAAVNTAFETSEGLADGSSSAEWLALVATKSNWTINLA